MVKVKKILISNNFYCTLCPDGLASVSMIIKNRNGREWYDLCILCAVRVHYNIKREILNKKFLKC